MNVRAAKEFYDREAGVVRRVGDEFEAGDARVASLVSSLYGRLVELVADKPATRPKQAARSTRGRATKDG